MIEGFPDELEITPVGDEPAGVGEEFVPQGFLLGAPPVIFPYRSMAPDNYYGGQKLTDNPILNAPMEDARGGTIYFEASAKANLDTILRAMGVGIDTRDYAAFAICSGDPVKDRFLDQMRLVSKAALATLFKVEKDKLPAAQTLSLGDGIAKFIEAQRDKWNGDGQAFPRRLRGSAGGDGDWAKEALAFGLHVENGYWGVYRVWSRAWLATK